MLEQIENLMIIDWWWDEQEYRVPSKARMERERQTYKEEDRGDSDGVQGGIQGYMD